MKALIENDGPEQGEAPNIFDAIEILWIVEDGGDEGVEGREGRGAVIWRNDGRSRFAGHHYRRRVGSCVGGGDFCFVYVSAAYGVLRALPFVCVRVCGESLSGGGKLGFQREIGCVVWL